MSFFPIQCVRKAVSRTNLKSVRTIPMIYKEDIVKFIEPDDPSFNLSSFNRYEQFNPFNI